MRKASKVSSTLFAAIIGCLRQHRIRRLPQQVKFESAVEKKVEYLEVPVGSTRIRLLLARAHKNKQKCQQVRGLSTDQHSPQSHVIHWTYMASCPTPILAKHRNGIACEQPGIGTNIPQPGGDPGCGSSTCIFYQLILV